LFRGQDGVDLGAHGLLHGLLHGLTPALLLLKDGPKLLLLLRAQVQHGCHALDPEVDVRAWPSHAWSTSAWPAHAGAIATPGLGHSRGRDGH